VLTTVPTATNLSRPKAAAGVALDVSGGSWKADGISTLYRGIVKRAGLGTPRFNDLRHTAAFIMLQEGLPITTVAAILGHTNTSTILSVYAHAIKGSEQGAAKASCKGRPRAR
jgi:integrase